MLKENLDFTGIKTFQIKTIGTLHSHVLHSTALISKIWLDLKYRYFCEEETVLQKSIALQASI